MAPPGSRRPLLLLAALAGTAGALAILPRARSTASAQLGLALGRPPEWMRAVYGGPRPRLERLAAVRPGDVELQIAIAILPASGNLPAAPANNSERFQRWVADRPAQARARLEELARRFPKSEIPPAHLLRYLSAGGFHLFHRTEVQELERNTPPPGSMPPTAPDASVIRHFDTLAATAERLEPENAYFTAMRAAAAFAARRDREALRYLHAAAAKPYWKDHAGSATVAQWRLMPEIYGDQGALQKLAAVHTVHLPHYLTANSAARLALLLAARKEHKGERAEGRAIRHDIMRLGATLADGSPTSLGRSAGVQIFQTSFLSVPPEPRLRIRAANPLTNQPDWRPPTPEEYQRHDRARRNRFAAKIAAQGDPARAAWIRRTGDRLDAIPGSHLYRMNPNRQADTLRARRLGAWWIFGVALWWEILAMLFLGAAGALLSRVPVSAVLVEAGTWGLVHMLLFLAPALLLIPVWWTGVLAGQGHPVVIAAFFGGLALSGMLALAQWRAHRQSGRAEERPPAKEGRRGTIWLLLSALIAVLPAIAGFVILRIADTLNPNQVGTIPVTSLPAAVLVAVNDASRSVYPLSDIPYLEGYAGSPQGSALPFLPALATLPALALLFLALLGVVARNLPLWSGLGQRLQRTAPLAALLLFLLYLASLPPTLAVDRAVASQVERTLTEELGVTLDGR